MLEQKNERKLGNLHPPGRFPIDMILGFMQQASVLLVRLADQEILLYPSLTRCRPARRQVIPSWHASTARVPGWFLPRGRVSDGSVRRWPRADRSGAADMSHLLVGARGDGSQRSFILRAIFFARYAG